MCHCVGNVEPIDYIQHVSNCHFLFSIYGNFESILHLFHLFHSQFFKLDQTNIKFHANRYANLSSIQFLKLRKTKHTNKIRYPSCSLLWLSSPLRIVYLLSRPINVYTLGCHTTIMNNLMGIKLRLFFQNCWGVHLNIIICKKILHHNSSITHDAGTFFKHTLV